MVVNGDSPLSRELAHRYRAMRDIPESHVCVLRAIPHLRVITLDQFKSLIARPILAFLKARGLEGQIDLITYSADFPYAVRFKNKPEGEGNSRWFVGNQASLTGATYLMHRVLAGEEFWKPDTNPYFRLKKPRLTAEDKAEIKQASQEMQARRFQKAAAIFRRLVQRHPGNPALSFHLARCLAQTGTDGDAFSSLARAIGNGFPAAVAQRDGLLRRLRSHPKFQAALRTKVASRSTLAPRLGFVASQQNAFLCTMLGYTGERGNSRGEILRYLDAAAKTDGTKPRGTVYFCRNKNVRTRTRQGHFEDALRRLRVLGRPAKLIDADIPQDCADVMGAVVGIANFDWKKSKSRIYGGAICEHLTSHGGNFASKSQTKLSEFLRYGAAGASGSVQEPLALQWKFPVPQIHVFYAEGHSLAEAFYQSVEGPYQLLICGDGLARPFTDRLWVNPGAPQGPWKGTVAFRPQVKNADGARLRYELWVNGRRQDKLELNTIRLDDGYHDIRVVAVVGDVQTRSYATLTAEIRNDARKIVWDPGTNRCKGAKSHELLWGGGPVDPKRLAEIGPGPIKLQWRAVFADGYAYRAQHLVHDEPLAPAVFARTLASSLPGLEGIRTEANGRRVPVVLDPSGNLAPARTYRLNGRLDLPEGTLFQLGARGRGTLVVNGKDLPLSSWRPILVGRGEPLELVYTPKGKPRLELFVNGDQVMARAKFMHDGDPPVEKSPLLDAKLIDGKRVGQKIPVPETGLDIAWKRTERKIISVTLFGEKLPGEWTLSATRGKKPREVADVTVVRGPGFVQLRLPKKRSAKLIRVTPKGKAELAEVLIGVESRR